MWRPGQVATKRQTSHAPRLCSAKLQPVWCFGARHCGGQTVTAMRCLLAGRGLLLRQFYGAFRAATTRMELHCMQLGLSHMRQRQRRREPPIKRQRAAAQRRHDRKRWARAGPGAAAPSGGDALRSALQPHTPGPAPQAQSARQAYSACSCVHRRRSNGDEPPHVHVPCCGDRRRTTCPTTRLGRIAMLGIESDA